MTTKRGSGSQRRTFRPKSKIDKLIIKYEKEGQTQERKANKLGRHLDKVFFNKEGSNESEYLEK